MPMYAIILCINLLCGFLNVTGSVENLFKDDNRPIILYDGVCNLCNGGVNLVRCSMIELIGKFIVRPLKFLMQMLDWDMPKDAGGSFRFASLQSEVGKVMIFQCEEER